MKTGMRRWKRIFKTKMRKAKWSRRKYISPLLPKHLWNHIKYFAENRYPKNKL